ncbi:MAG: aminoacyl-tRNA hydrolase [Moraxellaceae bacterium]|nr:aminoacyl-tRNA hydrolase [Pseudobdellovibrionaceae bacterium]
MHLVVGLGNYGAKYAMNRHNIGFMCVDVWLKTLGEKTADHFYREEHKALTQKIKITRAGVEKEILIAKPQTYMNRSGESVISLMQFYKIERSNLLVIQDDIDQVFGAMKIQFNRGHGGQNGIRNISELFGAADYHRLKLGVGRPEHPGFDIGDYVLGNFPKDELLQLPQFLDKAALALESFVFDGASRAATKYNGQL